MGYWDKEFAETRARVMARQEMEEQAAQRQQTEIMAKLEVPMLELESMWHGYGQRPTKLTPPPISPSHIGYGQNDTSMISPPVTPSYNYPEPLGSTPTYAMGGY